MDYSKLTESFLSLEDTFYEFILPVDKESLAKCDLDSIFKELRKLYTYAPFPGKSTYLLPHQRLRIHYDLAK